MSMLRYRRRAGALGLALAAAIIGLVAWRMAGETPAAQRADAAPAPTSAAALGGTTRSAVSPQLSSLPVAAPDPERGRAGVSTDDPLTAYRKLNVYPPSSRPLTREQVD